MYSSFPIKEQAEKGDWDYRLQPVYSIGILDFQFEKEIKQNGYLTNVQLKDQYCNVFYDKLTFIMIEMPRFQKTESELETHFDKWLYFLKNLENFNDIPSALKEEVFLDGFQKAEMANFNSTERDSYETSLKRYRDLKGVIDTSFYEGLEKGKIEGEQIGDYKRAFAVAQKCIAKGMSDEDISDPTGLSVEEVRKIRKSN